MPIQIVFTDTQFISILEHITTLPTHYNNIPYYNCGYYNGLEWSWDCWNLIKTIIWGWNESTVVGSYTYNPGLYGLYDVNGYQLLNECYYVSTDFSNLTAGEYLYYNGTVDHAGIYIGNRTINGHIVNVVECTPIWNNGVQYSYIDNAGVRYQYLGASPSITWTAHGWLPWIDYTGQPIPTPTTERNKLPIWMLLKYFVRN